MKKALMALLVLGCMVLGFFLYQADKEEDKEAPVIHLPEESMVYQEGENPAVLLEGVTVYDLRDGDITDTLVIESVIPMENREFATVLYYAKDHSNNVAKASRIVEYRPADAYLWEPETELETEVESGTEPEVITPPADGTPYITLTTDAATVDWGGNYNLLSYVKDIIDDQDGDDWLYTQIHIDGMYSINGPGTYKLCYTVVDRQGHQSNEAWLTLTVK